MDVDLVDEHIADTDGQTVALDLVDEALRASLERRLISELCSTGINVLNRNSNPRWKIGR